MTVSFRFASQQEIIDKYFPPEAIRKARTIRIVKPRGQKRRDLLGMVSIANFYLDSINIDTAKVSILL